MKRTIVIAAILGLAANAFAFQSSEVSNVLRDQLKETFNADILHMGTADFANATWGGASDLGSATGQDAVSAKDGVVNGAKNAYTAVAGAASSAGNYVFDNTINPVTYQGLLVPTGEGAVDAKDWIAKLPGYVKNGVSDVYYGLGFTGGAVVGQMGVTGTGKATSQDAGDLSNTDVGQSNLDGTSAGVSNAATVGQSKASSTASAQFSSAPVDQISAYKQEKVRKVAQAARRIINAYGADSEQAVAAVFKVGQIAGIEARVQAKSADEVMHNGILYTIALNM